MEDEKTRELNMAVAANQSLDNHNSVWSGNALATAKVAELSNNILAVEQAVDAQDSASTGGESDLKILRKHEMALATEIVSHGICLRAFDDTDLTIYNKFNINAPAIEHMKDVECLAHCIAAKTFATDPANNAELIADYDVTPAQITDLTNAINQFGAAESGPVGARSGRTTAVTTQAEGLRNIRQNFRWLDHFVAGKKLSNPAFHTDYFSSRKISDIGVRHVSARTFIFDSVTNLPLYLVKVTAANATTTRVVKSGTTGRVWLFSLPQGTYTLTIEYPGYQTQTINNVGVVEGKITTVPNILLVQI